MLENHELVESLKGVPQYTKIFNKYIEYLQFFHSMSPKRSSQVEQLHTHLARHTNWLTAPASCRHHNSFLGGLLTHSVGVCTTALELHKVLMPDYPKDSVILVSLFHDLGKVGNIYDQGSSPRYTYDVYKSGTKAGQVKFSYNKYMTVMPLAVLSLYSLSKFVDLTEDEAQAIVGHDGQFIPENQSLAHNETPLLTMLHFADYWTGHVLENNLDLNNRGSILSCMGGKK